MKMCFYPFGRTEPTVALKVIGYVYLVSKGKIVYQCTPEELKNTKETQVKYLAVEV